MGRSILDQNQVQTTTLGYASITSNFQTSSTTQVQATGLSVTVTIPSGGRKVKITAFAPGLYDGTAATHAEMDIWDGTVGSGTALNYAYGYAANSSSATMGISVAIVTPAAGSKTYNVGLNSSPSGTSTIESRSTGPAFILVELI